MKKNITEIIQNLDSDKAHRCDMINIRIIKLYGESVHKSLKIILKSCTEIEKFLMNGKANFVPVHKKEGRCIFPICN